MASAAGGVALLFPAHPPNVMLAFAHSPAAMDLRARPQQQRQRSSGPDDSLTWSLQALLVRHEAFILDAEESRLRMTTALNNLEIENKDLAAQNTHLVEENRALLEKVDGLNATINNSDVHIESLTATLHSTQYELRRLTILASRAEQLEVQLLQLEIEQGELQETTATTEREQREIVARWYESDRMVSDVQCQVVAIEKDVRDERLRHAEVVERMERRRAIEKELNTQPERLKGVAGAGNVDTDNEKMANEVVSNFVKEILLDNANMQLKMFEQQDELAYLEQEMAVLREQTLVSPSLGEDEAEATSQRPSIERSLRRPEPSRSISQELHVHHHYHAPTGAGPSLGRGRSQMYQRQKRKRPVIASGRTTTTTSASQSPCPSSRQPRAFSPSSSFRRRAESPLNSCGLVLRKRSSFALSSGPDSPQSTAYCPSTIFERAFGEEEGTDYSRPTSPESADIWSPRRNPTRHRKGASDVSSFRPLSLPNNKELAVMDAQLLVQASKPNFYDDGRIVETQPRSPKRNSRQSDFSDAIPMSPPRSGDRSQSTDDFSTNLTSKPHPPKPGRLRRAASTSSLLPIRGMDIHSTFPPPAPPKSKTIPLRTRPSILRNTDPILTATTAEATRSTSDSRHEKQRVGRALRETLGASKIGRAGANHRNVGYAPLVDTFGRTVGGWLTGRWT